MLSVVVWQFIFGAGSVLVVLLTILQVVGACTDTVACVARAALPSVGRYPKRMVQQVARPMLAAPKRELSLPEKTETAAKPAAKQEDEVELSAPPAPPALPAVEDLQSLSQRAKAEFPLYTEVAQIFPLGPGPLVELVGIIHEVQPSRIGGFLAKLKDATGEIDVWFPQGVSEDAPQSRAYYIQGSVEVAHQSKIWIKVTSFSPLDDVQAVA